MKILVVSEGKHELNLDDNEPRNGPLVRLIARVIEAHGSDSLEFERRPVSALPPRMMGSGKAGNYEHRAMAWVRFAEIEKFDAIVLLVDQDKSPARREGLDAAQINTRYSLPRAMGLAVKTFDAWMLADEQAISMAINKTVMRQKSPEAIKGPKQVLHSLIDGAREPRTIVYLLIAEYTNLDTLCERCPEGFGPFHARLASLGSRAS